MDRENREGRATKSADAVILRMLRARVRARDEGRRDGGGRDELERVAQDAVGAVLVLLGLPRSRPVGVDATNALDAHGRGTTLAFPNFFFVVDVGGDGELRAAFSGLFNLFANGVGS